MSIFNLDAKQASATFDSRRNTVTITHEDSLKNGGKPLEIPVGALRSVTWGRTPRQGRERLTSLTFVFRRPRRGIPRRMQVGRMRAVTTRTNMEFVEKLQDAIAHTQPNEDWQPEVDYATLARVKQRTVWANTLVSVLVVAVVTAGIVLGVQAGHRGDHSDTGSGHGADSSAAGNGSTSSSNGGDAGSIVGDLSPDAIAKLPEAKRVELFHEYLLTLGIDGSQQDEVSTARAVCQQFDGGYTFDHIAVALLNVDNGMTAQQKGQFISASVTWWCPQYADF